MSKEKKMDEVVEAKNSPSERELKLGYRLGPLRILEYRGRDVPQPFDEIELGFTVNMGFGVAIKESTVVLIPSIRCFPKDSPDKELCFLSFSMGFVVEGLDLFLEGDLLSLPPQFLGALIGVSLGTARGLLYAKNFGTSYANGLLPPLNIAELIPKDPFNLAERTKEAWI